MSDETPVEGEAFAAPESQEKPKRARVARAKPLHEEEAEKKAEEARRARTVGRAPSLMEADAKVEVGSDRREVECIVLNKGEGRIHTGEIDPVTKRPSFYAADEKFHVAESSAIRLETRGYAQRVRG
jgi:hypothetical protein